MADELEVTRAGRRQGRPQIRKKPAAVTMTKAKRAAFLMELGETCNVTASARSVGLNPTAFHKLRQRDPEFREAWMEALAEGYAKLELTLLERAINGAEKEVRGDDGAVTTRREFSERLALDLLRQHRQAVTGQRARVVQEAAERGEPQEDTVGELIARIAEMSDRLADGPE